VPRPAPPLRPRPRGGRAGEVGGRGGGGAVCAREKDRDQTRFGEAAQRRQIVKEGARIRSRPTARSS
jgi:hypothetical protein